MVVGGGGASNMELFGTGTIFRLKTLVGGAKIRETENIFYRLVCFYFKCLEKKI